MRVTRRALLALTLGTAAAALGGCRAARAGAQTPRIARQSDDDAGRSLETIEVSGLTRRYIRYRPPGQDSSAPLPLVLVLHGAGGSGAVAERAYGMTSLAEREGFVVIHPDAEGDPRAWNAGFNPLATRANDVGFVRALVEREATRGPLDPRRMFVCGHSSGAMMSYRLAGEASDLFPAVGIVAGSIGYRLRTGASITVPEPARPVSVIHIHGTDDPLVPYQGGGGRGGGGFFTVAESIDFWVRHDGCNPAPDTESAADGSATRLTYGGGRDGTEVTLWTIQGGGHEWPGWAGGSRRPDPATPPLSATALIWAFFAAHPRPA